MTIKEAYDYGVEKLQEAGITNARQDSFYLLEFVTGVNRGKYYANEQRETTNEEQREYISLIDKRRMRVPLQHLIGTSEFMGLPFEVNPHVLIPRQETEVLVETALEIIEKYKINDERWGRSSNKISGEDSKSDLDKESVLDLEKDSESELDKDSKSELDKDSKSELDKENLYLGILEAEGLRILDMCTGSGCIMISTLYYAGKELPKIVGVGVDISGEALEVAKKNAIGNGFSVTKVESSKDLVYNDCKDNNESQIILIESDLFVGLDALHEDLNSEDINSKDISSEDTNGEDIKHIKNDVSMKFNIILSNPPYIPTNLLGSLEEEVRCHDPILALDGGEDGLYFYRQIIEKSRKYLLEGGSLIFECGWDQGVAVSEMMKDQGFANVKIIKDLSGLDRVVIGNNKIIESNKE